MQINLWLYHGYIVGSKKNKTVRILDKLERVARRLQVGTLLSQILNAVVWRQISY